MGKGSIQSYISNARYNVNLIYGGRARVNASIAAINAQIDKLEIKIAGMEDGTDKTIALLELAALEKSKAYYTVNMPDDRPVTAYCVDLTEDLSGDVGTIEVPGERQQIFIRPGYEAGAVYDADRDGQLQPSIASLPASTLYNLMLLPGWQKFKPTYRTGVIVPDSIDFDVDTCDICLDPAYSTQQNLDVNQSQGFSECSYTVPAQFTNFCSRYPTHPT